VETNAGVAGISCCSLTDAGFLRLALSKQKKLWLLFLKEIFEALVMLTDSKNGNSYITFHG